MDSLIFTILNMAAVVTVHTIAVTITAFVVIYFARSQWNRSDGGRPFMIMAVGFMLFVDGTIIRYWVPLEDTPYRRIIDLTIYLSVLIGWVWLLVTLLRAQHRASRERKKSTQTNTSKPRLVPRPDPWEVLSLISFAAAIAILVICAAVSIVRAITG